jgi:hypothetical protein
MWISGDAVLGDFVKEAVRSMDGMSLLSAADITTFCRGSGAGVLRRTRLPSLVDV